MQFIMQHYADDIEDYQTINEIELMKLAIEDAENYGYKKPRNIEEALFILNDIGDVSVLPAD